MWFILMLALLVLSFYIYKKSLWGDVFKTTAQQVKDEVIEPTFKGIKPFVKQKIKLPSMTRLVLKKK